MSTGVVTAGSNCLCALTNTVKNVSSTVHQTETGHVQKLVNMDFSVHELTCGPWNKRSGVWGLTLCQETQTRETDGEREWRRSGWRERTRAQQVERKKSTELFSEMFWQRQVCFVTDGIKNKKIKNSVKNKALKKRKGAENKTFLAPWEEEHFLLFTFYSWTALGQYLSSTSAGKYAPSRRQN